MLAHLRKLRSHDTTLHNIQHSAASDQQVQQFEVRLRSPEGHRLGSRISDLENALKITGMPGPWMDDAITDLTHRIHVLERQQLRIPTTVRQMTMWIPRVMMRLLQQMRHVGRARCRRLRMRSGQ